MKAKWQEQNGNLKGCGLHWWYESQFETISYEQDSDGINNINTGSQGDVEMYEPKGENQSEKVGKSAGSKNP